MNDMKTCSRCHEEKPVLAFRKNSCNASGLTSRCRGCIAETVKVYRNPLYRELRNLIRRDRAAENPEKYRLGRKRHSLRKYGISWDDYHRMLMAQGGKCVICRQPPAEGKRLVVDHSHASGEVRGLLCVCCNSAIGLIGESAENLLRAVVYLKRNKSQAL